MPTFIVGTQDSRSKSFYFWNTNGNRGDAVIRVTTHHLKLFRCVETRTEAFIFCGHESRQWIEEFLFFFCQATNNMGISLDANVSGDDYKQPEI